MDLGATVCTPRHPACGACPLRGSCAAYAAGDPSRWPMTDASKPVPFQVIGVGVVYNASGEILIDQRLEEGLMDLGAPVCTPRHPAYGACPLRGSCAAYAAGDPSRWPMTDASKPVPFQVIGVGVVYNASGEILIDQRLEEGLLGGMWEFPGGKQEPDETIEACIARELREELGIDVVVEDHLITVDHAYSHKKLRFVVHLCTWLSGDPQPLASQQVRWVQAQSLGNYAFPAANARIIEALLAQS